MPAVHVESGDPAGSPWSRHVTHGAFPEAEKEVPATHGTWHTMSAVLVHAVLMPGVCGVTRCAAVHVESAAHVAQGAVPKAEKVSPATHGTGLHTVSVVLVQAVFTPAAHVESAAHVVQGAVPKAEKVVPAAHASAGAGAEAAGAEAGSSTLARN